MKNYLFFIMFLFLCSCAPQMQVTKIKSLSPLNEYEKVNIVYNEYDVPEEAELLATVKLEGNMGENVVADKAVKEARKMGGNIVYLKNFNRKTYSNESVTQIFYSSQPFVSGERFKSVAPPSFNSRIPAVQNPENTPGESTLHHEIPPKKVDVRFALDGGWGYRVGKAEEGLEDYLKKLRSGFYMSSSLHFISPRRNFGFGVEGSLHSVSAKQKLGMYTVDETIRIYFVGPSFILREVFTTGNELFFSCAAGYNGYTDKGTINTIPVKIQGNTFGMMASIAYDINLSRNFALGFKMSFNTGLITKAKYTQHQVTVKMEDDIEENISTFNLTFGIRFK